MVQLKGALTDTHRWVPEAEQFDTSTIHSEHKAMAPRQAKKEWGLIKFH